MRPTGTTARDKDHSRTPWGNSSSAGFHFWRMAERNQRSSSRRMTSPASGSRAQISQLKSALRQDQRDLEPLQQLQHARERLRLVELPGPGERAPLGPLGQV